MRIDLANYTTSNNNNNKRLKINEHIDLNEYKDGSLIKLILHNFVTYKLTEFTLSPSLNMIIGPNGSGKSTFVCAICLGLSGKTEYIGRMKKVEDFIKNGEDLARIDTYLRDSSNLQTGTVKVTRFIYRNRKKSSYQINDQDSTEQQVRNLIINKFNIQLDNLCQFLSQERVEEFARLKSDKLLIETIRSIDSKLLIIFEELKSLQDNEITTQREIDLKKTNLENLLQKRQVLNEKVSLLKEYEEKMKEIEYHKDLLPYVYIKDHKLKLKTYKNDYKIAKNQLKDLMNEKRPFIQIQEKITTNLEKSKRKRIEITNSIRGFELKIKDIQSTMSQLKDDINKKKNQIEYYENRTERVRTNIREKQTELTSKERELTKLTEVLPNNDDLTNIDKEKSQLLDKQQLIEFKISELNNKARQHNNDINQLNQQISSIKRQLTSDDKISILNKIPNTSDLQRAIHYIRQKHDEMKDCIWEPPTMTVSMESPKLAAYLNVCVDSNTSKAITLKDSSTYEKFNKELLQYKVNLRELDPAFNFNQHRLSPDEVKSFGFDGYLSDFVKGNSKVIDMLCQTSNIHLIPISTKELSITQVERLCNPKDGQIIFKKFIHGTSLITVQKSRSKHIFTRESEIKNTNLYQTNVMTDDDKARINREIEERQLKIDERKQEIENLSSEKGHLSAENSEINKNLDELSIKLHKWNNLHNKHSSLIQDIETLKEVIKSLKHEANKDVSNNIQNVKQAIFQNLKKQTNLVKQMIDCTNKMKSFQDKLIENDIKLFENQNFQITLTDVLSNLLEREEDLRKEYQSKKEIVKDMRDTDDYKSWMEQIKQYDNTLKITLNKYAEEYEKNDNFNVSFIKDMIDKLESEVSMINHDASSITILQNVEKEIEELESELPKLVSGLKETKTEIEKKHEILVPQLESIISQISAKFGRLFVNVGSAGEVRLEKLTLYNEWNVEILVKFRDTAPLKRLDSHTQSGGERAVSTILYMIALQEFTMAPFRVVDEINQGMDQRNERIVHKAMVENACAENTSQYFLITPKLLTNLHYHPKMRIHCVMAGPWIPNPNENPDMLHFGETSNYVF
ncbi:DNA repair ATPase SMC5 PWA37_000086 [Arxiozyma heterogenica]|uniref:DNA repair ATPase SMC5 n=1 Tax=Arxiozyma heterogenica TaxID=278026 RepID=UPI002EE7E1CF